VDRNALDRAPLLAATHISRLVTVDGRVYKRKLPQAFGFVDQRSLADRRRLCEHEVMLNRRICPDVYLGLEAVTDPDGTVVDWAVVMRLLPASRSLAALLDHRVDVTPCLDRLARIVASFHARAARSPAIDAAATPAAVASLWDDSLDDLARLGAPANDLDAIRAAAHTYLDGRHPLLAERAARGLAVDGHGDLLCADIYCLDDGPRVLDCLEFDERFRYGDVLLDVAFLLMDLRHRGRPDLAARFLSRYQEHSGEHHPGSLAEHFTAYRALVRAKVARYRAGGDPAAQDESERLLTLCRDRLHAGTVRLVLVGGLPGTGKSTIADALGDRRGWVVLGTDRLRREGLGEPAPAAWGRGAYDPAATAAVYRDLSARAAIALARGESVVVDGSFHDTLRRNEFRALARKASAALVELRCVAAVGVADARLRSRDPATHPSDATPAVAAAMAARFAPWPEALELDTGGTLPATLERLDALVDAIP
jgi:aminoglycoside phosphotransferase family enzyme/predicted kinase